MGAKDALAKGARAASYFNSGKVGEDVEIKNVMSDKDRDKLDKANNKFVKPTKVTKKDTRRLVPKNDQIIVQRRKPENFAAGGLLVVPDQAKESHAEGFVVEVSEAVTEVKKGDYILFGKYAGTEHQFGVEIVLFMSEKDVIATVEN